MAEVADILSQYGNSLADMRKLAQTGAAATLKTEIDTAITEANKPRIYTAQEAQSMFGVALPDAGYMLKITPDKTNVNGYRVSYVSPNNDEFNDDDTVTTADGKSMSFDDYNKQQEQAYWDNMSIQYANDARFVAGVPIQDIIQMEQMSDEARKIKQDAITQVFGNVFPTKDIQTVLNYAQSDPDAFLKDIHDAGKTDDSVALLKLLFPDITDVEVDMIFTTGGTSGATPLIGPPAPDAYKVQGPPDVATPAAIQRVMTSVFADIDIDKFTTWIQSNYEDFTLRLQKAGRSTDTDMLLYALFPDITEEQIAEMYAESNNIETINKWIALFNNFPKSDPSVSSFVTPPQYGTELASVNEAINYFGYLSSNPGQMLSEDDARKMRNLPALEKWKLLTAEQKQNVIRYMLGDPTHGNAFASVVNAVNKVGASNMAAGLITAPFTIVANPIAKQITGQDVSNWEWALAAGQIALLFAGPVSGLVGKAVGGAATTLAGNVLGGALRGAEAVALGQSIGTVAGRITSASINAAGGAIFAADTVIHAKEMSTGQLMFSIAMDALAAFGVYSAFRGLKNTPAPITVKKTIIEYFPQEKMVEAGKLIDDISYGIAAKDGNAVAKACQKLIDISDSLPGDIQKQLVKKLRDMMDNADGIIKAADDLTPEKADALKAAVDNNAQIINTKDLKTVNIFIEDTKTKMNSAAGIIKAGDLISDGSKEGIVIAEGTQSMGKNYKLPAYKVKLTTGPNAGAESLMVKSAVKLLKANDAPAIPTDAVVTAAESAVDELPVNRRVKYSPEDMAETQNEIGGLSSEIEAMRQVIKENPLRVLDDLWRRMSKRKDQNTAITIKEYQMFTSRKQPLASSLTPDGKHVKWEYAADVIANNLGYETADDLLEALRDYSRQKDILANRVNYKQQLETELRGMEANKKAYFDTYEAMDQLKEVYQSFSNEIDAWNAAIADAKLTGEAATAMRQTLRDLSMDMADASTLLEAAYKGGDILDSISKFKKASNNAQLIKAKLVKYVNDNLPVEARGRMLAAVKNVKTERGLAEAITRVEKYAEQATQASLRTRIAIELKATEIKKVHGAVSGKYNADVQARLDAIRAAVDTDRVQVRAQMVKNIDEFNRGVITSEEFYARQEILNASGISGMVSNELQAALETIQQLKMEGQTARMLVKQAEEARLAKVKAEIINEVTGGEGLKPGTGTLPDREINAEVGAVGVIDNNLLAWPDIMDKLGKFKQRDPFTGPVYEFGARLVVRARESEYGALHSIHKQLENKFDEIFGVHGAYTRNNIFYEMSKTDIDMGTFINRDGKATQIKMTKAEMMKRYQEILDPSLNDTFVLGMRWTDEMVNAVVNGLTPEERAWAEYQMDFYQQYYDSVNAVYSDLYGVDLPHNRNYSPISRDFEMDVPENQLVNEDLNRYASVLNGSLKSRASTLNPLKQMDANAVFLNHITQMEHFKAWAKTMRDLRSAFGNSEVRAAIKQYHGINVLKQIDNNLNMFARGGVDRAQVIHWLDSIRTNVTRATLGVKPSIAIQQVTALPTYLTEMPLGDFIYGVADFYKNPVQNAKWLIDNVPYMKERYFSGGLDRDIRASLTENKFSMVTGQTKIKDLAYAPMTVTDAFGVMPGFWAKYKSELKRGLTQERAIEDAIMATDRTQNTSSIDTLSAIQNGGSFMKIMTMYQSQTNKFYRMTSNAMRNLRYGRGDARRNVAILVMAWVIQPVMFQYINDGFKFNKERQLRTIALGPFNNILIFSEIARAMGDVISGDYPAGYRASPLFSAVNDLITAASKGKKLYDIWQDPTEDITVDDLISFTEAVAKVGGEAAGIPTPYFIQVEKAIRSGQPLNLVFSEWALKPPTPSANDKVAAQLPQLGTPIQPDPDKVPELSIKPAAIYDMTKLNSDIKAAFDKVLPSDITKNAGDYEPVVVAWAKKEAAYATVYSLQDIALKDYNTDTSEDDTIIEYYKQWQARSKLTSLAQIDDFDKLYPKAYLGNVTRRQYELLTQYAALTTAQERAQFIKDHPEMTDNPRDIWLKEHPAENAQLAIFGQAKIMSKAAYDIAAKMVKDLDIPDAAVMKYLPPADVADSSFKYIDAVKTYGANSPEAILIRAQNPNLNQYLGLDDITKPIKALEIDVKNRALNDEYNGYADKDSSYYLPSVPDKNDPGYRNGREYAREQFKVSHPEWVADQRRIEAYNNGANDSIVTAWVERGVTSDKYGPSSPEAKLYLLDNPSMFQWALKNELLTDDGKDWNRPVLEIDAKYRANDTAYDAIKNDDSRTQAKLRADYLTANPDYAKARIAREGYQMGLSAAMVSKWSAYYSLPEYGYSRDRYRKDNPDFDTAVLAAQKAKGGTVWASVDPSKIPDAEYDNLYVKFKDLFDAYDDAQGTEAEREATRKKMLAENSGFRSAWYMRKAYKKAYPTGTVKDYAAYYDLPTDGYARERYLKTHPELYAAMQKIDGLDPIDFKKVPSAEVEKLTAIYDKLPTSGKQREAYRKAHPELDAWLILVRGLKPLGYIKARTTAAIKIEQYETTKQGVAVLKRIASRY